MDTMVNELIEQIYRKKDYDFFANKCKESIVLPLELREYISNKKYELIECNDENDPSKIWWCKYSNFVKGEFSVSYTTTIKASKIAPVFYMQHEFEVENKDVNRMSPVLDGFDGQPYTKEQFELEEIAQSIFKKHGYKQLSYAEMNEVVADIKLKEITIFGSQATVEILLFHDLLDLCEE